MIRIEARAHGKDRDWMPEILAARVLLKDAASGADDPKKVLQTYRWLFAVKCGKSPMTIVSMGQDGKNDAGLKITWPVKNGIATRFSVGTPGCLVLAQKRAMPEGDGTKEVVYTAYNVALDTPSMRKQGQAYLESLRDHAYDELRAEGIHSIVFTDRLVADVIPKRMAFALNVTEHIDPNRRKYIGSSESIHEVLITIAANRDGAYAYAGSSMGARGIAQIIPATYELIRQRYPAAGLLPGFTEGTTNQPNAVKAAILLFDIELHDLDKTPKRFTMDWFLGKNAQNLGYYLAAAYNCNATLVARVYAKTGRFVKPLPAETQTYVKIAQSVFHYFGV